MSLRVVCLSDTHGLHDAISGVPAGDVLLHAGDLTKGGTSDEIVSAVGWLSRQPFERIICIGGNHDFALQRSPLLARSLQTQFPNVEILFDSDVVVQGLRIYGAPWTPWFHDWAFNFLPGPAGFKEAEATWARIPDDTAILITHGPVYGILDKTLQAEHVGCKALKQRIAAMPQLMLHVCGHIHESYGSAKRQNVLYVNASACDVRYRLKQRPIVVEVDATGARRRH